MASSRRSGRNQSAGSRRQRTQRSGNSGRLRSNPEPAEEQSEPAAKPQPKPQRSRSAREAAQAAAQKAKALEQAQAQAKLKAQADAKAKAEAQARARVEAEAQAKAQAQAEAQAQAKLRAQAEAKAKAEAQAKAKAQAQAKAKAKAEPDVQTAAPKRSSSRRSAAPAEEASPRRSGRSSTARSSRRQSVPEAAAATRSSGRQSARVSGRQSARMEVKGGGKAGPIIIAVLMIVGIGVGSFYAMQGEDHRIRLASLEKNYVTAFDDLKNSLDEGILDSTQSYYDKGIAGIQALEDYAEQHQEAITESGQDVPSTAGWPEKFDKEIARLPGMLQVKSLRDKAISYQIQLNALHRVDDLSALEDEIQLFTSSPKVDGKDLDPSAMSYFKKQVAFLNEASKTIDGERDRRKKGFKKPTYKNDTRNDLQKRSERSAYETLRTNIPHKLKKNKFSDAFKTLLVFHEKFPFKDIDEDWEKVVQAEEACWTSLKSEAGRLIDLGQPANLKSAHSKLANYLDAYGNENFGNEARAMFAKCK